MRIHRLRIQAFGPFAGEVEADVDALSEAGLFLLTGATGAGKTSVLDAISFALYGAVPGDRQIAKRLRADQAAPGVAPQVTLELTLAGRRLRVDRSPGWERPKKRGTGTTTQQPSVLVQERVDGEWVPRATRLDEAGHLLGDLLGMTQSQFCQVQLLPQGRFQTFLRSGSDDRQRLLQQLFRTSRFEDVEAWLRERRRALGRESSRHQEQVAALTSRVSEAAGVGLPEEWDLHALAARAESVERWSGDLLAGAAHDAGTASVDLTDAVGLDRAARTRLDDGRRVAERQRRHARAAAEHAQLLEGSEEHAADGARLEAGRRAAAVLPLLDEATRTHRSLEEARGRADHDTVAAARVLDADPDGLGAEELTAHAAEATDAAARARAHLPQVAERDRLRRAVAADRARLVELTAELTAVTGEAESLPEQLRQRRAAEAQAQRAADGVEAAEREVVAVRERRDAARSVLDLVARRVEAADLHRGSVDEAQALRETWLELQEARLHGMAAEIAGGLAVGAGCPVCGSAEHPRPAEPIPGAPDAEAVRRARSAVDDAEVTRHARELAVADLDARIGAARERAGHRSVAQLDAELACRAEHAEQVRARAQTLPDETARREQLELRQGRLHARAVALAGEQAGLATALAEREERLDTIRVALEGLLADSGHETVAQLLAALERAATAITAAARSVAAADRSRAEAAAALARATESAHAAGFADPEEARAAASSAGDLAQLQARVDDRRARVAAVESLLADPELRAAAATEPPDLDSLAADQAAAASRLDTARDRATSLVRRHRRLVGLHQELARALAAWAPVRADHELADRLATLLDGTSPDNRLRMRLSGYVLAFRLRQVVAAANERLTVMLDGRYRLEHAGDRGAGETRGGLSLRVRDEWSGESRDPATLSGGETFVVSLALALGLADVITHEAGGAELDTLFVDEGFGTLDADSLDHVMDMLDTLRDGGRVVGVVSHVAELQTRIPTQLHVEKRRTGSTLHQHCVG